ncbi:hypothetical protein V495_04253 [Pseudogymnoascus sp. VKM F-4514 (FW-929)]|nr:hypothetical protein V495_04253 [Pseudogymnoascus sp. VKM F-4514 (FW-929)]KFY57113.1 hypothetical protein V497_05746 [Pseudogymnoascus sp. VKM F-4516 (FW-969)]
MASVLVKLRTAIFGPRQHRKIAIMGLDGAGGIDLLEHLCGTTEKKYFERCSLAHTGTKSSLKCDFEFVVLDVGGSGGPPRFLRWTAAQFTDADGIIWVVDSADSDRFVESQVEMGYTRMGREIRDGGPDRAAVSPDVPFLVLSIAEATRQAELVITDAGDNMDWTFRAVSITTSEGIQEALGWLYKKVK